MAYYRNSYSFYQWLFTAPLLEPPRQAALRGPRGPRPSAARARFPSPRPSREKRRKGPAHGAQIRRSGDFSGP